MRLLPVLILSCAALHAESVTPGSRRPDDFDSFWDAQLAHMAEVPMDAVLTPRELPAERFPAGLAYAHFSIAVGPGERVRGQVAHPDRPGEKFPALVVFQWAGVYPLSPYFVTGHAAEGWLCVNVSAHDLPIDEPAAYYEKLNEGPLKHYWTLGADDCGRSYFRRMFLGTRRALDLVREHPAWDGRVLVVQGNSQGGSQALVAAAFEPRVTAVLAHIPAFCDQHAPLAGRAAPFPKWLNHTENRDPAAVARAALYYDMVHFAPRITAPVLISAGERDSACPPEGIRIAARALGGPHELFLMPDADHPGSNQSHETYHLRARTWLSSLLAGGDAPGLNPTPEQGPAP